MFLSKLINTDNCVITNFCNPVSDQQLTRVTIYKIPFQGNLIIQCLLRKHIQKTKLTVTNRIMYTNRSVTDTQSTLFMLSTVKIRSVRISGIEVVAAFITKILLALLRLCGVPHREYNYTIQDAQCMYKPVVDTL